jgi:hypothetical protein
MRFTRTTILAGAASLLVAGTAAAAADALHKMDVALPDGSVAQIEYAGDVAPTVTVVPADLRAPVAIAYDPFAGFDRIMAAMEARHQAMMLRMAAMQKAASEAADSGQPGQFVAVGALPAGVQYSYVSSTTDANGCTHTVEYSSAGGSEAPKVTRASAGNCDSATPDAKQPITVSAPTPAPAPAQALPRNEV